MSAIEQWTIHPLPPVLLRDQGRTAISSPAGSKYVTWATRAPGGLYAVTPMNGSRSKPADSVLLKPVFSQEHSLRLAEGWQLPFARSGLSHRSPGQSTSQEKSIPKIDDTITYHTRILVRIQETFFMLEKKVHGRLGEASGQP